MKLIGSKVEAEYRDQLVRSHQSLFRSEDKWSEKIVSLFSSQRKAKLGVLKCLRREYPDMRTAYCIDWTAVQDDEFYCYLIDMDNIIYLEFDRIDLEKDPIVETISLKEYKKGLKKMSQIKLAVAMDLAQSDLNKAP